MARTPVSHVQPEYFSSRGDREVDVEIPEARHQVEAGCGDHAGIGLNSNTSRRSQLDCPVASHHHGLRRAHSGYTVDNID